MWCVRFADTFLIRARHNPVIIVLPLGRGRGMPRPYCAMIFYCPVGRGDLTPPGEWATAANFPLISHLR